MKNKEHKKYMTIGVTAFVAVSLCILLYFLLEHFDKVTQFVNLLVDSAMPIVYGAAIAYVLYPVCGVIERFISRFFKKVKNRKRASKYIRSISIALSILFGLGVVTVIVYLIIPELINTIVDTIKSIETQNIIADITKFVETHFISNESLTNAVMNFVNGHTQDLTQFVGSIKDWGASLGEIAIAISTGAWSVVVVLKNLIIGIIVAVYILAGRGNLKTALVRFIDLIFSEPVAKNVKDELGYANFVMRKFICGKILDSTIIGIICFVAMEILGLPYALLISVIVGVTNVIPFFGPFIGAIPSALLLLLINPWQCLIFVIMIIILQQIDGNIIGPRIVGEYIGLSSFWVLFSILIFSGMFGLVGMIIGVPVFAIIYDIIKKVIIRCEERKKEKQINS